MGETGIDRPYPRGATKISVRHRLSDRSSLAVGMVSMNFAGMNDKQVIGWSRLVELLQASSPSPARRRHNWYLCQWRG